MGTPNPNITLRKGSGNGENWKKEGVLKVMFKYFYHEVREGSASVRFSIGKMHIGVQALGWGIWVQSPYLCMCFVSLSKVV